MALDLGIFTSPSFVVPTFTGLSDTTLLDVHRAVAEMRRRVDAVSAALAAETAHRSRPELGYDGLAQRLGARTPERLLQQVTGVSAREANALVRVGTAGSPIVTAVATATIGLDAAHVIRAGLGSPTDSISQAHLDAAAQRLLAHAPSVTVERLAVMARAERAALDATAVEVREEKLRQLRSFRVWRRGDGMIAANGVFAPEDGAILLEAYDAATAPRRGGPRFVSRSARERAERLVTDERSTEQIAADAFIELVRLGGAADTAVLGTVRPAVRLVVTDADLRARLGAGRIEGSPDKVGLPTVDRVICDAGIIPVRFDTTGHVVDIGRSQRLFTHRQRIALAVRDGGCRFPGCDRPPSWCEAHHLVPWSRGGRTDLADGILLCRHHHMLIHNNGWSITREIAGYFVVPPDSIDPRQARIPAPSRHEPPSRETA